ncbi:MAG: hypothetical protein J5J06_18575, partial [Phycisphaerae bacterium]|nr:hypothetical protein [Phycisphaerae bacterium]
MAWPRFVAMIEIAKVWRYTTLLIDTTDSTFSYGGVAFAADPSATVANVKIGYDNNADNDIDDAGDDLVVDISDFSDTSHTPAYDDAGNLVDDGQYIYRYDAWNRLVKVRAKQDDVTIQTAHYDGTGRRIKKVVSNRGDLDATELYYYDGWKVIEIRQGSGTEMDRQYIHGTQYIDEHIMMRAAGKGDL